jgi:hypothetical protein
MFSEEKESLTCLNHPSRDEMKEHCERFVEVASDKAMRKMQTHLITLEQKTSERETRKESLL